MILLLETERKVCFHELISALSYFVIIDQYPREDQQERTVCRFGCQYSQRKDMGWMSGDAAAQAQLSSKNHVWLLFKNWCLRIVRVIDNKTLALFWLLVRTFAGWDSIYQTPSWAAISSTSTYVKYLGCFLAVNWPSPPLTCPFLIIVTL